MMSAMTAPIIRRGHPLPLLITLYDPITNEGTDFIRSYVPWGILKKAIRMLKNVGKPEDMTDEDIDSIAALVVEAFGDRFTVADLDKKSDVGEMMTVIKNIVSRAEVTMEQQKIENPTLPPGTGK